MTVELIATSPSGIPLGHLPEVIERDSAAGAQRIEPLPGNYHCLISRVDDQLVVWDLGERNDMFVNGIRTRQAALKTGDTLRLGGADFAVKGEQRPRHYLYGLRC